MSKRWPSLGERSPACCYGFTTTISSWQRVAHPRRFHGGYCGATRMEDAPALILVLWPVLVLMALGALAGLCLAQARKLLVGRMERGKRRATRRH